MVRPLLLDLFCGAGGCAVGYHRAGFDVVGVDIKPQPRYPFVFVQADVMEVLGRMASREPWNIYRAEDFAAIHASPPCQAYSRATAWRGDRSRHADLIGATRSLLEASGRLYVIENVQEARHLLHFPIMLCGSMFGLRVQRHRYFETFGLPLALMPSCQHKHTDYSFDHGARQTEAVYRDALGCDWMTVQEARQAIPPAYTYWLGKQLIRELEAKGG